MDVRVRDHIGRLFAVFFATVALIAACSPVTPTLVPLDHERFFLPETIAAHAPTGWMLYETKLGLAIPYGGPIFLANQPFPDPCAGSTQQAIGCMSFPPPVQLEPGGVVVGSGGPRATQRPRTGRPGPMQ